MDRLPRLGKRELICLLLFTCNYVVSVWRGFLFLWVPGIGYVILLWHSLSLPYNYFAVKANKNNNPLFVGETSAGKSSLLNLLLGTDVLPHSLLCATATICRLHYSKDKRVEIESCDGDIKTIPLDESDQTSEALHKRLKPYISSKEMRFKNSYKNVDIYWPLALLQVAFYFD